MLRKETTTKKIWKGAIKLKKEKEFKLQLLMIFPTKVKNSLQEIRSIPTENLRENKKHMKSTFNKSPKRQNRRKKRKRKNIKRDTFDVNNFPNHTQK